MLSAQYVTSQRQRDVQEQLLLFTNCMKYIHLEHDVHDNNTRHLRIMSPPERCDFTSSQQYNNNNFDRSLSCFGIKVYIN